MKYSGMAMQMGVIILVGVWIGQWLDAKWGTAPYLLVTLALFSVFAALYTTLKDLM
ncbi:MAG: AtpZ/AtpI family protein [Saprospiraceae bacterium]